MSFQYPQKIGNWIEGREQDATGSSVFEKLNPADGKTLGLVAKGAKKDIDKAVEIAVKNFEAWSSTSVITRSDVIRNCAQLMQERKQEIAEIVSIETGKSVKDALGEVGAAIEMGFFVAGEGRRGYGRTTASATPNRSAQTRRQPVGICGLITPANTPVANVAWKVFPALLCGNTVVLKPPEDAPFTAMKIAIILKEAGLPDGVLGVINGMGETGSFLVDNEKVDLISFTGSVAVGRFIQSAAAKRLAKVCLELGGKNALVVCDDADIAAAVNDACLSAFSNAGQRCASGSRLIVFETVYEEFKKQLLEKTATLKMGSSDADDFGPVINLKQLNNMLAAVEQAQVQGVKILCGGKRMTDDAHAGGFFMEPTILECEGSGGEISRQEIFGPITCLYKVKDLAEAIDEANDSDFGLTAAIHTASIHRAQLFQDKIRTGVVSINGPTYGSEPHMPFGGLKNSGNGYREAGTEALDVYSEWKTIYVRYNPAKT